jgi:RHS repeat-associated protein
MRTSAGVTYIHSDHLRSTSVTSGAQSGDIKYFPYGATRSGAVSTTYKFTGQRLDDSTGLYYYGARYYDPALGRFVQADSIVPNPGNPQALNRYSYVLNNPLRFIDPTGMFTEEELLSWGITQEQIDAWKEYAEWWAIIAAAQLYDQITALYPYTSGNPRPVQGYFILLPETWKAQQRLVIGGYKGYAQLESFRGETKDYGLWRFAASGRYESVFTPKTFLAQGPPEATISPLNSGIYFDPDQVDWVDVGLDAASIGTLGAAQWAKSPQVIEDANSLNKLIGQYHFGKHGAEAALGRPDAVSLALDVFGMFPPTSLPASILSLIYDLGNGFTVVWGR